MASKKNSTKMKGMPTKQVSSKTAANVKGGVRQGAVGRSRGRRHGT